MDVESFSYASSRTIEDWEWHPSIVKTGVSGPTARPADSSQVEFRFLPATARLTTRGRPLQTKIAGGAAIAGDGGSVAAEGEAAHVV